MRRRSTSTKPLIGISMASVSAKDWHPGLYDLTAAGSAYATSVVQAGGVPVFIPNVMASVRTLGTLIDGLLLIGGTDIAPDFYGSKEMEAYAPDPARDRAEFVLFQEAYGRKLPILGVCRGMQMMNVSFGGTMCAEIDEIWPGSRAVHMQEGPQLKHHSVRVIGGSRLARAIGQSTFIVASDHHQAIDQPGGGLIITATSPEGIPEAIEKKGYPFMVGVQWHPERVPHDIHSRSLFGAFISAAKPAERPSLGRLPRLALRPQGL